MARVIVPAKRLITVLAPVAPSSRAFRLARCDEEATLMTMPFKVFSERFTQHVQGGSA